MQEDTKIANFDKLLIASAQKISLTNDNYRKEIWTGQHLQMTVMSIPAGGEIGFEIHSDTDQALYVEYGFAAVYAGETKQAVRLIGTVRPDYVILIPSGTWHNVINVGNTPLKLISFYAPPHHPKGTLHETKLDSDLSDY